MELHWTFVSLLILLNVYFGFSSLDFIECGGDPVSTVFINGCDMVPCKMQMGQPYYILIQPEFIYPQVDNAGIEIGILQYGAYFDQNTTCNNPCIYSCPITTKLIEPQFDIHFNISSRMVAMTSVLHVNATYYNGDHLTNGFCVQVDIIVTN